MNKVIINNGMYKRKILQSFILLFNLKRNYTIFTLSNIYHYLRVIHHFYCSRIEMSGNINGTPFISHQT